ncbi:hypothetical protein [Xenorhabdus sp. TS4]|uniref:hypothetical protein n=1 Tax=Xenorhabdus sp. TS4 TaxID=1873483 RepID=UPI001656AD8C|nr:hypothetical protein [Xenorhabdus sp. TS4]
MRENSGKNKDARIAFGWRTKTPVACKGEQALRYICALLEAGIRYRDKIAPTSG